MTLVDANVLIDVATDDPAWSDWSQNALDAAASEGPLIVNPIIYAEVSVAYERIDTAAPFK
ncbi:MAG: hypothetical protein AAGF45_10320 [Pseudomonadota bacterium]